ncbi:MAG TPA: WbqC family protein, partial [Caulobacterales bacterium]|nr:WbqC family protein [Caulobacterales bacterium]
DKIAKADVFVFLDAVDYPKQSWTNRVRLNIQDQAQWVTCPVKRTADKICDAEIDDAKPWRDKLLKTLEANYARAPRFAETMTMLEPLVRAPQSRLSEFNINAIGDIARAIGLNTPFLRQTALGGEGASNLLLVSLVQAAGGDAYLIGGGAGGYRDDAPFTEAGIQVIEQNFTPHPYGPQERFIPGLSVIDYLMHDGADMRNARSGDFSRA